MNYITARHQRLEKIARELKVDKKTVDFNAWMQNALDDMEITKWNLQRTTNNL